MLILLLNILIANFCTQFICRYCFNDLSRFSMLENKKRYQYLNYFWENSLYSFRLQACDLSDICI